MYQQTAICCTLNHVPMTANSLQKSRLPFGLHLYPFAHDETIPISSDGPIVRCNVCRAYINPYARIGEQRSWQCNLCNRYNELPAQFIYDYTNQQYYDLGSKVELTSESVEYIASVEYMIRPPQPACYMFVFDCSKAATDLGYIPVMAAAIAELLDDIPGDARASIGFIAYDSCVHYFSFSGTQVVHHVCPDVSTEVAPCSSDGILANMTSRRELILDFLNQTLAHFPSERPVNDTRSAMGPAIKAAVKILSPIGGKVVVVQAQIANHGNLDDGSIITKRETSTSKQNAASDKDGQHISPLLNPDSEFYKELALKCCDHQISVDLFNLAVSHVDLASVAPITRFSAGTLFHYSNTVSEQTSTLVRFDQDFRNNLVKPIGLESVLRLRYSRGLKIHTFHGNFFVRSPNLLVLPNANPDASYALQIAIEDDLKPDVRFVYFQASVLYTTPDGERRIRVHTARYPTVTTLPEIVHGANQTAIVALLAKMAVDRSVQSSIGEAKEALIGAGVDLLDVFNLIDDMRARTYMMALPENLRLMPLYILALLKHSALKLNADTRIDDRLAAMERFKTLPMDDLITYIYPDLFALHNIATDPNEDWKSPLQLSAANIERTGAYLLDAYDVILIYVCEHINPRWLYDVFGVQEYSQIKEQQDVFVDDHTNTHLRPRDPANFAGIARPAMPPNIINHNNMHQQQQQQHNQTSSAQNNVRSHLAMNQPPINAQEISETPLVKLAEYENVTSTKLREFVNSIVNSRAQKPKFYILKEHSRARYLFTQYLIEDRSESYHSYAEFWKFLQDQAKN